MALDLGAARFNPRAREGRDESARHDFDVSAVSTHAPVKGATQRRVRDPLRGLVSTHAPVKGATRPQRVLSTGNRFQPTRP